MDIVIVGDGWKIFRVVFKRYYASLHSRIVSNCYKEFRRGNFKYTSRNCTNYGAISLEFSESSVYILPINLNCILILLNVCYSLRSAKSYRYWYWEQSASLAACLYLCYQKQAVIFLIH